MKPIQLFDHEIIVLPVNTGLVMGAGVAKQAAIRYPALGGLKNRIFWTLDFEPGTAKSVKVENKLFVLAATKRHWSNPSQLAWIESLCGEGPGSIEAEIDPIYTASIGIPALGCGLGGLDYSVVKPLLEGMAQRLRDNGKYVTLYPPRGKT